ncbi:MAG: hypothetical protein Homavirus18_9 [Homavirus sp.]|uniref:Uncharacterized protein n=1 Tax=Homavirus sp. TaxID=2487769 RepID=A0A3G5AA56_9VIRU|nr:MAG: hypothetical protein Homavirus18_9 [Homavirus sp.]
MTTSYLIMCINGIGAPTCKYIATSLADAQTQMASLITTSIAAGQAAYPTNTFTSATSTNGLASVVIMQASVTRGCDINGTIYPELTIANSRQQPYTKMYISTVTQ